jgi:hypothetical protein
MTGGWHRWRVPAREVALRRARRLGLPGAVGTLLMAAAGGAALVGLPNLRAGLQDDEQALRVARQRAAQAMQTVSLATPPTDPAARFVQAFPAPDSQHRRVERVLALAATQGLASRRSESRRQSEAVPGLQRLRLTVPVEGDYPRIRRYVELALRDDPALALDRLRLERASAGERGLRGELHWSLWMRGPDASRGPASDAGAR